MNLQPVNPYYIIEKLTEEVAKLEKENEELRKQIPTNEEESNVTVADSDS